MGTWHRHDCLTVDLRKPGSLCIDDHADVDQWNHAGTAKLLEISSPGKSIDATNNDIAHAESSGLLFPAFWKAVDDRIGMNRQDGSFSDLGFIAMIADIIQSPSDQPVEVTHFDFVRVGVNESFESDVSELLIDMTPTAPKADDSDSGLVDYVGGTCSQKALPRVDGLGKGCSSDRSPPRDNQGPAEHGELAHFNESVTGQMDLS